MKRCNKEIQRASYLGSILLHFSEITHESQCCSILCHILTKLADYEELRVILSKETLRSTLWRSPKMSTTCPTLKLSFQRSKRFRACGTVPHQWTGVVLFFPVLLVNTTITWVLIHRRSKLRIAKDIWHRSAQRCLQQQTRNVADFIRARVQEELADCACILWLRKVGEVIPIERSNAFEKGSSKNPKESHWGQVKNLLGSLSKIYLTFN